MRTFTTMMATSAQLNASYASSAFNIEYCRAYAVQANYASSAQSSSAQMNPSGTFSLWAANSSPQAPSLQPSSSTFVQIANSPVVISSSGSYMWNVMQPGYNWVQLQWAVTAGSSGLLNATLSSKGF